MVIGGAPRIPIPGAEGFSVHLGTKVHNAVVFLGYVDSTKPSGMRCEGTGFFLSYEGEAYLVTAAHVAQKLGNDPFVLRVNRRGKAELVHADNIRWVPHRDALVDVAATPLRLTVGQGFDCTYFPQNRIYSKELIEHDSIDVGDFCYTVGLFHFIQGRERNLPLVHSGNIALMPPDGERVPMDAGGGKTEWVEAYLIECRAINGASGSPVFARPAVTYGPLESSHGEVNTLLPEGQIGLLGLFQGAWFLPPDHPVRQTVQAKHGDIVPVGIGVVVPAYKIVELLEDDELKDLRKKSPPIGFRKASASSSDEKGEEKSPNHKEDFNRLLGAAVKRPKSSD